MDLTITDIPVSDALTYRVTPVPLSTSAHTFLV